jgi:hypothetical protein
VDRRAAAGQRLLQQSPALGEGSAPQVVGTEGEEVEGDEARRCLLGEQGDARGGRVDAVERASKSRPRGPLITISPSTTQRLGGGPAAR